MVTAPEARPRSPATAVSRRPPYQPGHDQSSEPRPAVKLVHARAHVGHYAGPRITIDQVG
jgi:hypothetical protein